MKTQYLFVSGLLLFFFSSSVFSQSVNYWIGGAPGLEREWNCPRNWSTGEVPNEFSHVVIPDVSIGSRSTPIVRSGLLEIGSLIMESNSALEVQEQATLVVHEEIKTPKESELKVEGMLIAWEEGMEFPGLERLARPVSRY